MDTVPGLARAIASGLNMKVEAYAEGDEGIRKSLEEMARIMRDARHDTALMGWAVDALRAKGIDGRQRPGVGIKVQAETLLNALREKTIYKPDPSGTEWIQAPHVTLCLRDLCIPAEDCDGLTSCLGGAMLSIGLPAYIVKQDFGPQHQQHVLVGLIDEKGKKWYADPSTNKPVTSISQAVKEIWLDPMEQVGNIGVSGAEIVTLGKPGEHCCQSCEAGGTCEGLAKVKSEPCCSSCANGGGCEGQSATKSRETYFKDGRWWEYAQGRWWVHHNGRWVPGPVQPAGIAAPILDGNSWWRPTGHGTMVELGKAHGLGAPLDFTPIDVDRSRQVHQGLRYKIEFELNFRANPADYDFLQAMARDEIGKNFLIESYTPRGPATHQANTGTWFGGDEVWYQFVEVVGVARRTFDLVNDPDARVPYRVINMKVQAANPAAIAPAERSPTIKVEDKNTGYGNALAAAVGVGAVVGLGYYMLRSKGK